ncbi:MAG: isovaleryl-CoA dehydrogenase [Planctomycetes bacterium]|nr:isovaleryl-CoA dehydrogenase [Planctomycetota bacterium]
MTAETRAHAPDEVFNQATPFADVNLYALDAPLRDAVARHGAAWIEPKALELGAHCGRPEVLELGHLANTHLPELKTHDRYGNRIDEVQFHPAWHELMKIGIESGCHSLPWATPKPGAHVARLALNHVRNQLEEGSSCPQTMTFAVIPTLRVQPELAAEWEPRVLSNHYDPRSLPADQKRGVLFGMAMTERQGGSDVRANTTRAEALAGGGPGAEYALQGHKWFCSAPQCDGFMVLAQAPGGLSCFLLPRFLPDGTRNAIKVLRLKSKLGNRSNASSEIEFHGARARLIGEEGRGVPAIIEMVRHTRLDCALGSTSTLRRALSEAIHHCRHRAAFGKTLIQQPLMQNVLADLCLDYEGALALAMRLGEGFDRADDSEQRLFTRLATSVAKYWNCKRAIFGVAECMEVLGGNGYVEDSGLPRMFRDVPVNSIWEGSGNVQCLDTLRAMRREPETFNAVVEELNQARGRHDAYDAFLDELVQRFTLTDAMEFRARRLVEGLALALQGSLLLRHAPQLVADAFCATRLGGAGGRQFGTLPAGIDALAIVERSLPG